jgi:hypothetical protein
MVFVKGQVTNPTGSSAKRQRQIEQVKYMARAHTEDAIKTLVKICNDDGAPAAARVGAATAILDRGYGKPTTYVEQGQNPLEEMDREEKLALLDAIKAIKPGGHVDLVADGAGCYRPAGSADEGID